MKSIKKKIFQFRTSYKADGNGERIQPALIPQRKEPPDLYVKLSAHGVGIQRQRKLKGPIPICGCDSWVWLTPTSNWCENFLKDKEC